MLLNTVWHERRASMSLFIERWHKNNNRKQEKINLFNKSSRTHDDTVNRFPDWWFRLHTQSFRNWIVFLLFIRLYIHAICCQFSQHELYNLINFHKLKFDLCRQDWKKNKCIEMFWLIEKSHRNLFALSNNFFFVSFVITVEIRMADIPMQNELELAIAIPLHSIQFRFYCFVSSMLWDDKNRISNWNIIYCKRKYTHSVITMTRSKSH